MSTKPNSGGDVVLGASFSADDSRLKTESLMGLLDIMLFLIRIAGSCLLDRHFAVLRISFFRRKRIIAIAEAQEQHGVQGGRNPLLLFDSIGPLGSFLAGRIKQARCAINSGSLAACECRLNFAKLVRVPFGRKSALQAQDNECESQLRWRLWGTPRTLKGSNEVEVFIEVPGISNGTCGVVTLTAI